MHTLAKSTLSVLLVLPASLAVLAGAPVAAQVDVLHATAVELQRAVAQVWPRTGEIWPGVDFGDHFLLFTDGQRAWAADREKLAEAPADQIPTPLPGGFDMMQWQGRKAVVMRAPQEPPADVRNTALELFDTASHEQFHDYVQFPAGSPWPSLKPETEIETRGELYPLRAEPRIQRMMLANELLAAHTDPANRQQHLAAAAYWQDIWAQGYPLERERMRLTDIKEGTAAYFGIVAAGMASGGDYAARTLQPMQDERVYDLEPYRIGPAALLVAEQLGMDIKPGLMQQARTPAEVVLAEVTPTQQSAPADLRQIVQSQTDELQADLPEALDPFITAYRDKSRPLLTLPSVASEGSVQPSGFWATEGVQPLIMPLEAARFQTPSGTFEIKELTVGLDGPDIVVPLDLTQPGLELADGKLTADTPNLQGSIAVTSETVDGRQILRAQM